MNFAIISALILWAINIIAIFWVFRKLEKVIHVLVKEIQEVKTRLHWMRERELKIEKEVKKHGK